MKKQFNETQSGFQTRCNAVLAITDRLEKIRFYMSTIYLFFDLSKAFDTAYHDLMTEKLENYGVRRVILSWVRSRLQTVFVKDAI